MFRNPVMIQNYNAGRKAYAMRHRDLFLPNGDRRSAENRTIGSTFAQHFWRGYDGAKLRDGEKRLVSYAYYVAGRDCRKHEPLA